MKGFQDYVRPVDLIRILDSGYCPRTNGNIQRCQRVLKDSVLPVVHRTPSEFADNISAFPAYYDSHWHREGWRNCDAR